MRVYNLLIVGFLVASLFLTADAKQKNKPDCSKCANGIALPDPKSCSCYYICHNGNAKRKHCGHGLYFDAKKNICNLAYLVDCPLNDITTVTPSTTTTRRTTSTPKGFQIPTQRVTPTIKSDPNENLNACNTPTPTCTIPTTSCTTPTTTCTTPTTTCTTPTTTCTTPTITSPCETTTPPCQTTTPPCETTTLPCETTTPPCETTTPPCETTAPPCGCQNSGAISVSIESNSLISSDSNFKATNRITTKVPTSSNSLELSAMSNLHMDVQMKPVYLRSSRDCLLLKDGTILLDQKHCRRYYVCRRGKAKHVKCRSRQWFDYELGMCRDRGLVTNCAANSN